MLEIENLYFSYNRSSTYLLNDINLKVPKGSYVSIVGDNGCGKSTLVKLILGEKKPLKGTIKLYTNRIGYIPQRVEGFNPQFPITVSEMLNVHRKALGMKGLRLNDSILEKVGMKEYKNSLIGNLSGGQLQKVFIARALMGQPELLVLDEPSTAVDVQSQREIYSIIKGLNKDFGVTVISVEHNLNAALLNSTHIFKIENGKGILFSVDEYTAMLQEV
ncbi:metal ABC transporter ATP-binding protein [Fonticella tunisiensis]|uniref:Zinc transport system ATP-binding protein n=1 Tax=Fonticella tunisiensis TaxID=1096341 RepID=A0A4R7KM55_9CLOT|nr:metal ABC transporter ATP-binding protein [Fonticella tunisiensis]TDT57265.1 zinc transport system ATP-binding protein [Fonticella tunisiensis]